MKKENSIKKSTKRPMTKWRNVKFANGDKSASKDGVAKIFWKFMRLYGRSMSVLRLGGSDCVVVGKGSGWLEEQRA